MPADVFSTAGAETCPVYSRVMNERCAAVAAWLVRMYSYSDDAGGTLERRLSYMDWTRSYSPRR